MPHQIGDDAIVVEQRVVYIEEKNAVLGDDC